MSRERKRRKRCKACGELACVCDALKRAVEELAQFRDRGEGKLLTESEWALVFRLLCKTKQGQAVTDEEQALIMRAFVTDKERYTQMGRDVFDATVPIGSTARARR